MLYSQAKSIQDANAIISYREGLADKRRAMERQRVLNELGQRAFAGDDSAVRQGGAISPKWASEVQGALNKMNKGQRDKVLHETQMKGRVLNHIQTLPPALRPAAYQKMIQDLPRMGMSDEGLSPEYDPNEVNQNIAAAVAVEDMITSTQKDLQAQGFQRGTQEFADALKDKTSKQGTEFKSTSSDENTMMKFIIPEFGNVIDLKNGIFKFATPEDKKKAREVLTKATRIYDDAKGKKTRAEAVSEAMQDEATITTTGNPFDQFDRPETGR